MLRFVDHLPWFLSGFIAAQALLWEIRYRLRPRRRYLHWWDADTPSTCSVAGHELSNNGYCEWCDDVTVFPAHLSHDGASYHVEGGALLGTDDPRIISFNPVGNAYSTIPGYIGGALTIDRSMPTKKSIFDLPAEDMDPAVVNAVLCKYAENAKAQKENSERSKRFRTKQGAFGGSAKKRSGSASNYLNALGS